MARPFLTAINLNQNEIQNGVDQNLGTAPTSPKPGQFYYDTTATFRLQWNGTAWINSLNRASHFGTQLASTISNFAATAQSYSLNLFAAPTANVAMGGFTFTGLNTAPSASGQAAEYSWVLSRSLSAFAAPTASIPMGGFVLTGLGTPTAAGQSAEFSWVLSRSLSAFAAPTASIPMAGFTLTGLPAPTAAGQAAEYSWVIGQVQSAAAGIPSKPAVQAIATSNITLTGLQTIDGYTTVAGDRILVAGQTTTTANGVYNASSGAWTRTTIEGAAPGEMEPGALWLVINGTANAGTQWRCSNTTPIIIGTTAIAIIQFGAAAAYTAGNGITLAGNVFSVNPVANGGIVVGAGGAQVDTTVVARKFSQTIGDGATTSYVVTHNLGTQDVHIMVRQAATPFGVVECDMSATSTTTATIAFATAPAANSYRVTIIG
jgi:hypothetical protein